MTSQARKHDGEARFTIGAAEAREALLKWLRGVLEGPDKPQHEVKIALMPRDKNGNEKKPLEVFVYDFEDPIDQLVKEILKTAEDDAEHFPGGRMKYVVRMEGRDRSCTFSLSTPARFDEEGGEEFDDMAELPGHADRNGAWQMQLQHNQVFAKEMVSSSRSQAVLLRDENRDLRSRVADLETKLFEQTKEFLRVYENLNSMQWERDRVLREDDNKRADRERITSMLLRTGPMLAAMAFGGSGNPMVQQLAAMMPGMMGGGAPGGPPRAAPDGFDGRDVPAPTQAPQRAGIEAPAGSPLAILLELNEALLQSIDQAQLQTLGQHMQPMQLQILGQIHHVVSIIREARGARAGARQAVPENEPGKEDAS